MKRFYSTFFLLLFIAFLAADSVSHHNHDNTDRKGIVSHKNFEDCKLCLFSNVNSNSFSNYKLNSYNLLERFDTHISSYELVIYRNSFNHCLSLRGPPQVS